MSRLFGMTLALAGALAPTTAARAFELTRVAGGSTTAWTPPSVRYAVVLAPALPDLAAATRASFDAWTSVPGSALIAAPIGTATAGADVIVSRGDAGDALAITSSIYRVGTATIVHADIVLSAAALLGHDPGAYDLESVIVHEAGHALGLAHTCGDRGRTYPSCFDLDRLSPRARAVILGAVMAPTIAPQEERRSPTPDDAAGLVALYPGTRGAAPTIGVISRDCPGDDWIVAVSEGQRVAVAWRAEDGRTTEAVVRSRAQDRVVVAPPADPTELVDLVVDDPVAMSRATRVSPLVEPCAIPDAGVADGGVAIDPEPPAEGCACAGLRAVSMTWALAAICVLLAARRRR